MKMILSLCLSVLSLNAGHLIAQQSTQETIATVEAVYFSEQELDQMLAPIALYPDTVLAHILIAATYPLEVVQAARWTERNPDLEGDDALAAVESEDWDPSVKALVPFPDLLQRMSEELDWTQRLGDAFLDDEERITARIQTLRQRAYDEGNLNSLEHLKVVKEEETIVIEPAVREVVYVPYYDTRYVYGSWWWDAYPPVYWRHRYHHHTYASFYWGPRVYLSSGFFFSGFHWHNRHVVVIDRHHHRRNSHYYTGRHVVRHTDSRRWHHNPRHRRGVDYRNPRTRDYFENKRFENRRSEIRRDDSRQAGNRNQSRQTFTRDQSSRSETRVTDDRRNDNRGQNLRSNRELRNADYVRDRLNNRHVTNTTPARDGANGKISTDRRSAQRDEKRSNGGEITKRSRNDGSRVTNREQERGAIKRDNANRDSIKLQNNRNSRTQSLPPRTENRSSASKRDVAPNRGSAGREIRGNSSMQRSAPTREVSRSDRGSREIKASSRSTAKQGSSNRSSDRSSRNQSRSRRER